MPDTTPPTIEGVTPTPGTAIEITTPVGFDVLDETGLLRRVLVAVHYAATGITELAHDGDAFLGPYGPTSTRDPITNGFRYRILRDPGWPSTPTVRVFAFDQGGNEV